MRVPFRVGTVFVVCCGGILRTSFFVGASDCKPETRELPTSHATAGGRGGVRSGPKFMFEGAPQTEELYTRYIYNYQFISLYICLANVIVHRFTRTLFSKSVFG